MGETEQKKGKETPLSSPNEIKPQKTREVGEMKRFGGTIRFYNQLFLKVRSLPRFWVLSFFFPQRIYIQTQYFDFFILKCINPFQVATKDPESLQTSVEAIKLRQDKSPALSLQIELRDI